MVTVLHFPFENTSYMSFPLQIHCNKSCLTYHDHKNTTTRPHRVFLYFSHFITEHSKSEHMGECPVPSFGLIMGPPMSGVEDQDICSSPPRRAPINAINPESRDTLLPNSCLALMNQEMGHIVFNCTLIILHSQITEIHQLTIVCTLPITFTKMSSFFPFFSFS